MLTVNEIFHSIQGESTRAGEPCVFVRLTACDLRCSWCDTPYAFHQGRKMSVDDVVAEAERYGCRHHIVHRHLAALVRSEEHTSELQSLRHLVCRLLLEKKNKKNKRLK